MQATEEHSPQPSSRPQRHGYRRLVSRFLGASVVATGISQLVFVVSYSLGAAPVVATTLTWLAGAIPNFVLNRRTWGITGREGLRGDILRFGAVSVTTALLAAFTTSKAEGIAQAAFEGTRSTQHVIVVWGTFAATYLAMAAVKFVLIDRVVFSAPPQREQAR